MRTTLISALSLILFSSCNMVKEKLAPMVKKEMPKNIGQKANRIDGQLTVTLEPCDSSKRNCVSSYETLNGEKHYLPPFNSTGQKPKELYDNILKLLLRYKSEKVTLISQNGSDYIYAEFQTALGFTDDVEFSLKEKGKVHFRSASRLGYWDVGKNKKRMEDLRFKFQQRDY